MRGLRRKGRGSGGDGAAARGAYGLLGLLAALIDIVVGVVALIIILGILFVVLGANEDNGIVDAALDAARFLVGPFDGIFKPDDRKLEIAINWGIALVVYVAVGRFVASLLRRPRA